MRNGIMLLDDIREIRELMRRRIEERTKGGPGSGHRGHAGRPGHRGGSVPGATGVSAMRDMARGKITVGARSGIDAGEYSTYGSASSRKSAKRMAADMFGSDWEEKGFRVTRTVADDKKTYHIVNTGSNKTGREEPTKTSTKPSPTVPAGTTQAPYLPKTLPNGFDHEAEHMALYPKPPVAMGSSSPRPEATREQLGVYLKRKQAVEAASREHYTTGGGMHFSGPSMAIRDYVDDLILHGVNKAKITGPRKDVILHGNDSRIKGDTETEMRFRDVTGKRYVMTALNIGEYKRNY